MLCEEKITSSTCFANATEREPVQRILSHLGVAIDPPPLARARDPTDDLDDVEPPEQLELGLA